MRRVCASSSGGSRGSRAWRYLCRVWARGGTGCGGAEENRHCSCLSTTWRNNHDPLYWGDYGPANLPLLHMPVRMPSPFPHCSNLLVNMPWSPLPPGLYRGNLSPLMVPPYPLAPLYHPPPEPRLPDSRPVFQPPAPLEIHRQVALARHPSTHPPKEEPDENILSE
ncbi:hypothetical protein NL108_013546 [Boleophthalmus pectinirostris]|nr:hypothetical protein NL108_013546 [Boleophthalmus pectinirostris]